MTHMQRKEKGPRLSSVVYAQYTLSVTVIQGFISLSVSLWDILTCLFLKGLLKLHAVGPSVCFTARVLHITRGRTRLFFMILILITRQIFKYNPSKRLLFTGYSRLFYGCIHDTPPYKTASFKKTRNLWFEILFTMCMITNQCVIY